MSALEYEDRYYAYWHQPRMEGWTRGSLADWKKIIGLEPHTLLEILKKTRI
jgi:hypothetical protein